MVITAIILNYNNYLDVCSCIKSIENQNLNTNCHVNILVIDNGSQDKSTEKLKERFPKHKYIFNSENLGFAKGVNQGIDLTLKESDYFLLVNNDAELSFNCLQKLLETSGGNSLVGPTIFFKDNPKIVWQGGGYFSKSKMGIVVPNKNKELFSTENVSVEFLSGCIILIPKKVISEIGKLDEGFFFYGEDLDFCLRAKKYGISVIYQASAMAWHNIKRITSSRTSPFVLKNLAFSYILIAKKHFNNYRYYTLFLFVFIYTPFRFYQIIKGKNNPKNIVAWIKGGHEAWNKKL